jgi:hypothetical protein
MKVSAPRHCTTGNRSLICCNECVGMGWQVCFLVPKAIFRSSFMPKWFPVLPGVGTEIFTARPFARFMNSSLRS